MLRCFRVRDEAPLTRALIVVSWDDDNLIASFAFWAARYELFAEGVDIIFTKSIPLPAMTIIF